MIEVGRVYTFHAWHLVPGLPAPWGERHDHAYSVEVGCIGETDDMGLVVDTDILDALWETLEVQYREADLNEVIGGTTTVEDLAVLWLEFLRSRVPAVSSVTVWEDRARWGRATAPARES